MGDSYIELMTIIQRVQTISDESDIPDQETSEEVTQILQNAIQELYRVSDDC